MIYLGLKVRLVACLIYLRNLFRNKPEILLLYHLLFGNHRSYYYNYVLQQA